MFKTRSRRMLLIALLILLSAFAVIKPVKADDKAALNEAVQHIQNKWEAIKFDVPEGNIQTNLMNVVGLEADKLAERFPDAPEALIWDGVLTSERASMASAFSALSLANRARDILEKADRLDSNTLDAGAPTSLGVLYYRVPSFPIGFGDKEKARKLLEKATRLAPKGLDAWYFYGDFLFSQGEYAKAKDAFNHALAIPVRTDRPLWDHNRRLVIAELLQKMQDK